MSKYVLDASAVLALLNQEPGQDRVEAVLADSCIGAVNYCEVLGKLIDAGLSEEDATESVELLNLEVVPFDADTARLTAVLRPTTKKLGLSLGDRSCLALALARRNTALTAERAWAKLKLGVKIELIR
ncbi:MAG: type II toxin-antitoxin system VapC family toxin [Acidobacteriota bacterium]|nr:type II toxin-antitoxin system VapC family toxin [Acidobacteriota bacterium]